MPGGSVGGDQLAMAAKVQMGVVQMLAAAWGGGSVFGSHDRSWRRGCRGQKQEWPSFSRDNS